MKILKYITIILFVVGSHPLEAMKKRGSKEQKQHSEKRQPRNAKDIRTLLEVQEQEINQDIPSAPPQPTQKVPSLEAAVKREKVQKGKIKASQSPYSGYRKLAIILDPYFEKINANDMQITFNAFLPSMTTLVLQLAEFLAEKASPILVYESYLLENILISQIVAEKNIANNNYTCDVAAWAEMKKEIQNTFSKEYQQASVPESSDFFTRYKRLFPEGISVFMRTPDVYPLDKIAQEWLLFEYHGQPAIDRAYLLIPYNKVNQEKPSDAVLHGVLTAAGFNPNVFRYKSMHVLKKEISERSDYSAYTKGGVIKDMRNFSLSVLPVVNQALTDDAMKPWLLFIEGHGYVTEDRANDMIAGISADIFSKGLLPLLIDKNSRFCYITSCYIGGINKDVIREAFSNVYMTNNLLPEFTRMLGRRPLKYPNNLIMVLGGISDVPLSNLHPYAMPTRDIESFNKAWSHIDKNDPIIMDFMPFFPSRRIDLFFDALIKHLSAEEGKGKSIQKTLVSWKDVVRYMMPYIIQQDTYAYEHTPQIRFPFYDAPFNVIDVDQRIQVLRYVDVKARALGAQLKGKVIDKPIIVDNKDMLIVYPLSVTVPLEIKGKVPVIVPARAGIRGIIFKKIICDTNKDLQNTIHTLFTYEARASRNFERTFFVEELRIGNSVYKDVLGSSIGMSAEDQSLGQYATSSVYYRTSDDKIMMYIDDQRMPEVIEPIIEEEVSDIKGVAAGVIEQISEEDITEDPYAVRDMEESINTLQEDISGKSEEDIAENPYAVRDMEESINTRQEDISGKIEALKESISKEEAL